jgi:hypothetical protein
VPVNVNDVARASMQAIEPYFHAAGRPPVTPEVHLGEPAPTVEADPDLLRAALDNLLLHCLDAMTAGGTLAIRTREKDSLVRIEVSARGASLGAEDCQRLFVPAGTAPNGMTGLGFATAHAIVHDHGGRIYADSPGETGLTVRLELPAATASAARQSRADIPRQAPVREVRKALVQGTQPERTEVAQPERTEPPVAAPIQQAEPVPVPVTIVAAEVATAPAEPVASALSAPVQVVESPSRSSEPSKSYRASRGLLFTE